MGCSRAWLFDGNELGDALRVRDELAGSLLDSFPALEPTIVWTVSTELITNVVRHAPGPAEARIGTVLGFPAIHVLDRGSGCDPEVCLPDDPLSEGGRGLFIVSALALQFELLARREGGSHAIAVLK